MNQIILIVDNKKTKHIYDIYDSEIVFAIDRLLFGMNNQTVHYKSVPKEEKKRK